MDHADAVRLNATERYLLNELKDAQLDEFEEHLFDCQECTLDLRAASAFLNVSKDVLAETSPEIPHRAPEPEKKGPFAWLRPAFTVPVMAALIAVIGFQNLVSLPRMQQALQHPQVMPWAAVNVGTWGSGGPTVTVRPGQSFLLFVRIPPETGFARYTADLYNPAGTLEWSLTFLAAAGQDQWPLQVPGAKRQAGTYTLQVRGDTAAGETRDLGRTSFDLQIQK